MPAVVLTESSETRMSLDLTLNCRLKEGDEVETGDWQSNTVFAGYPLMIEAKEFMYSWFVQNKRKSERNLGVMEERVWENNTLKGKPLSHHGHNHTC